MALTHQLHTLNGTPQLLTIAFANEASYSKGMTIIVQNTDQSKHVLLGSSTVSLTDYGHKLDPLSFIQLDLSSWDELYAISDSGTLTAAVIRISK